MSIEVGSLWELVNKILTFISTFLNTDEVSRNSPLPFKISYVSPAAYMKVLLPRDLYVKQEQRIFLVRQQYFFSLTKPIFLQEYVDIFIASSFLCQCLLELFFANKIYDLVNI